MKLKIFLLLRLVLMLTLIAAAVGAMIYFDAHRQVLIFLAWIEGLGGWGPVLFIVADMLAVLLVLPGVLFTLGAGFLFGVAWGTLYVVIGTTIGAAAAFLIARHGLRGRVAEFLMRHARLRLIDQALGQGGWKIVLLTRLIPFFPFKLSNYAFGLTRCRWWDFVLGTALGIVPYTLSNVYIGSLAADLATLGAREQPLAAWEWALYGLGLLLLFMALWILTGFARRTLAKAVLKEVRE